MRFGLRTLLLVTAIAPLLVGGGIRAYEEYLKEQQQTRVSAAISTGLSDARKQMESDPIGAEITGKVLLYQVESSTWYVEESVRKSHIAAICDLIEDARKRWEENDDWRICCYSNDPAPAPPSWLSIISNDCFPTANP